MSSESRRPFGPDNAPIRSLAGLLATSLMAPAPVYAVQFQRGELYGSFDNTLSYSVATRVQDRDKNLVGIANGGNAFSVNADDGNLNYGKEVYSNIVRIISELELDYGNYGAFVRGRAFYDSEATDTDRTRLTNNAKKRVRSDAEFLDYYASWGFELGEMPGEVRAGNQVVSWGESTFIPNGINTINPIDVNAIRLPGSEVREALLPQGMVWGTVSPTENISLEALYLYDWRRTRIDPQGTYFSANDFVPQGSKKVFLGFGGFSDLGSINPGTGLFDPDFLAVPRARTDRPDSGDDFGAALRVFVPKLNNAEFGVYFLKYDSQLPVINAITGSQSGAAQAAAAGTSAAVLAQTQNPAAAISAGTQAGIAAGTDAASAAAAATGGVNAAVTGGAQAVNAFATDAYAKTANYFIEYPEDIKLYGLSFSSELFGTGWALQGEVAYRDDQPLQVDDVELLFAALGPISPALATGNQVGDFSGQFRTTVPGFIEKDVTTAQASLTNTFANVFGANQLLFVAEAGLVYVHDMPSRSDLRLDAPATFISGNRELANTIDPATGEPLVHQPTAPGLVESSDDFASAFSWGYQMVGRFEYNNAIGPINLLPRLAWRHDVHGITPRPLGNYLQGRRAVTVGLGATYLNSWSADIAYTSFFGAGRHNLINDRDFVAFNIKYSF